MNSKHFKIIIPFNEFFIYALTLLQITKNSDIRNEVIKTNSNINYIMITILQNEMNDSLLNFFF